MSKQWWEVSSSYFGDYYPLTPYLIEGGWMAWQFNTPEKGEGFVQVFKRNVETSETMWSDTMSFKLQGLEPESKYMIKNMDVEATQTMTGAELMEKGIFIKADVSPSAYLFSYKKIQ
jgi:hypothetical protein